MSLNVENSQDVLSKEVDNQNKPSKDDFKTPTPSKMGSPPGAPHKHIIENYRGTTSSGSPMRRRAPRARRALSNAQPAAPLLHVSTQFTNPNLSNPIGRFSNDRYRILTGNQGQQNNESYPTESLLARASEIRSFTASPSGLRSQAKSDDTQNRQTHSDRQ